MHLWSKVLIFFALPPGAVSETGFSITHFYCSHASRSVQRDLAQLRHRNGYPLIAVTKIVAGTSQDKDRVVCVSLRTSFLSLISLQSSRVSERESNAARGTLHPQRGDIFRP